MKRKLIKQAGQALTITLPIEWVRNNGLKPGDEIDLDVHEKDLILRSGKKTVGGSIKLEMAGFPKRMKYTYLNSVYAKGFDEVELEIDKTFYPGLSQNIGFAVVSQRGNKSVIRDISGVSAENLDNIFKRVFQTIIGFYDSAIEDIFGESKEDYKMVMKIDKEINRSVLFLERAIMKQSYPDRSLGKIMFAYSFALEKLGDEVLRLWRTDIQNKVTKNKEVKEFVLLSKKSIEVAFNIYYQSNPEKIKELMNIRDIARKKSMKLLNMDADTTNFLMHAIKIIEDSYDLTQLSLMKKLK